MRGKFLSKRRQQRISELQMASWTPERKAKQREYSRLQMTLLWQNPDYRLQGAEQLLKAVKARWAKKGSRDRASEQTKTLWQDPEYLQKMKARPVGGRVNIPQEERQQMAARQKSRWADPEYRKRQQEMNKARWEDPEYRKKVLAAQERRRVGSTQY